METPRNEIEQLHAQMQDMQMEIDILKETINVLKKDLGIDQSALKNREKAVIVDKYPLPSLLKRVSLSKSSYYYRKAVLCQKDKYSSIRRKITELFHENAGRYGYRRIHGLLKREGITLSEKVVRRLMREEGLWVKVKRRRKCSSYQGEISPSVPNVLERDFHADRPNEKWLTDITEFALPDNWNKPGCRPGKPYARPGNIQPGERWVPPYPFGQGMPLPLAGLDQPDGTGGA